MKNYVIAKPDGTIIQYGSKSAESLAQMVPPDGCMIHEVSEPITSPDIYWKNGVRPRAPAPNQWMAFDVANEGWAEPTEPGVMVQARAEGVHRINSQVGRYRTIVATAIEFQTDLYAAKREEAKAFLSELIEPTDLTDYPLLNNEVGSTAPTARDLALVWLHMQDLWLAELAALEGIRMNGIAAIEAASTTTEIETHVATALAALTTLKETP